MDFNNLFQIGTIIKFAILFIPLEIWIFISAPSLKWILILTLGAIVGIVTALSGTTMRKRS